LLKELNVGTLFLEYCTERAGEIDLIKELPEHMRVGVGVVNPKTAHVETLEQVLAHARAAIELIGSDRLLLIPDCGFATFADSPVNSREIAEAKMSIIVQAAIELKK